MIDLTPDERRKFAAWLRQQFTTATGIAVESSKLPGMGATLASRYKAEAAAYLMVARILESTEAQTIQGPASSAGEGL